MLREYLALPELPSATTLRCSASLCSLTRAHNACWPSQQSQVMWNTQGEEQMPAILFCGQLTTEWLSSVSFQFSFCAGALGFSFPAAPGRGAEAAATTSRREPPRSTARGRSPSRLATASKKQATDVLVCLGLCAWFLLVFSLCLCLCLRVHL